MPVGGCCPCGWRFCPQAPPLRAAVAGLGRGLVVGGRPYMGAGRGWLPLLAPSEIVYPCILDPDGKDERGQASSSLAVSTRWISAVKFLQYDLATLAQREGGE
ncbi:hypothetical protein GW17_00061258 [Ensete ventricosum]|nr:hypothetical protein GW17_00061258 [Ensete ventricosum]